MPLASIENVTATVRDESHTVSLTIEDDGVVVGTFGKLPWAGAAIAAEVVSDGCVVELDTAAGVHTHFFIPESSFASFGGARVIVTFSRFLVRSATAAGARVVEPVA